MITTCDEKDWGFTGGPWCGKTYDDAECSTICPHDPLPVVGCEDPVCINHGRCLGHLTQGGG